MKRTIQIFIVFLLTGLLSMAQEARLLRFPAIHGDQIVFSFAGDLYTVHEEGGMARKLTTHKGYEVFPRFSPDGSTIAFTGQYDGNTEVFTIPSKGGMPQRITYTATLGRDDVGDRMGPNNIVMDWTPDGKHIVYRSRKQTFNAFTGQLFKVPVSGGLSEEIPLTKSGFCSFSPDGKRLAFNWVFREFRTWKYYEGGMADDIRIFDFGSKEVEKITDSPHQDIIPMWIGDEVYFLSDRDRTMNIFAYNTASGEIRKITHFTNYDVKFPSHSDRYIVFEQAGYIHKLDVTTGEHSKVSIRIADDYAYARDEWKDASDDITAASPSPKGNRLMVTARGEIYDVPVKEGITYNLTQSDGAHDRAAEWSPDGKYIAYLSDKNGEYEVYLKEYGSGREDRQLTSGQETYIFGLKWSPDSKKIAFNTKKQELKIVDVESGKTTLADVSDMSPYFSYNWSPDSKWIAYTRPEKGMSKVRLYELESKQITEVTGNWYDSGSPVFSRDGKYLFFTSSRDYNPTYSRTEWNHAYVDMSRVYLITLDKNTPSPLAPGNDEVQLNGEQKKESLDNGKEMVVDLEGIKDRIIGLPVSPGNYSGLMPVGNKIYYNFYSVKGGSSSTKYFDLEKEKETDLGQRVSLSLVPDGKKVLVFSRGKLAVLPLPSGKINISETVDLSNLHTKVDLATEWEQIFDESWRHMRDFFYDPGMHGVDWDDAYEKYKVFLPYVKHRNDLTYILGEMVGELNVGHAYVNNGERPTPERIRMGLLGAKLKPHSSGYVQFEKILEGANWSNSLRSPLREVGIQVSEGDFLIAVDGQSVKNAGDPYELLVNKTSQPVELTVHSEPSMKGSRKVVIHPRSDESSLYYYHWVQENIRKVSEATDGKVGYIHVPDMGVRGLNEFMKHYYPQLLKEGLIIDVRGNGGGNVSPMLIERLKRDITYATMHTNQKEGSVNPVGTHLGPKVALCDKYSASDGDLFPYRFKYNELGPLIGTTTWGGVVGYSGSIPCIDGGSLVTPSYAPYAADGSEFIIEGRGVTPDIVVENDPHQEYLGVDDQLNKAIEVILQKLEMEGTKVPPIPEFPDKSGKKK